MRTLLLTAVVMAKHGRERGGGPAEVPETTTAEPNRQYTEPPTEASDPPAQLAEENAPTVNSETGEVNGAGFGTESNVAIDQVYLPKKIVAKDIVGRAGLKMKKTARTVKNTDGTETIEWDVSPPREIYTVFGTASGTESGTTAYGEWTGFTGTFEAVRTEDGARFRSNRLILQEPAQSLLVQAVADVKKRDSSGSVNFAFEIGIRTSQRWVDTNEGNSYEYTIKSVFNVQQHDPLAHMRHSLRHLLPAAKPKQLTVDIPSS
jgi:hypothetical protein